MCTATRGCRCSYSGGPRLAEDASGCQRWGRLPMDVVERANQTRGMLKRAACLQSMARTEEVTVGNRLPCAGSEVFPREIGALNHRHILKHHINRNSFNNCPSFFPTSCFLVLTFLQVVTCYQHISGCSVNIQLIHFSSSILVNDT
jgi:hypothetical protein